MRRLPFDLDLFFRQEFSIISRLKIFLQLNMPGLYNTILRKWGRNNKKFASFSKIISSHRGLLVLDGPFAGMKYVPCPSSFNIAPKLLGCYELELHDTLSVIVKNSYKEIINIGCAEGYYAVGLALRMPNAKIYAFEKNDICRNLCRDLANANGVDDRVTTAGACEIEQLQSLHLKHALIICDCEGYETNLLRPDIVPDLKVCDILVELHDVFDPTISQTIQARFNATHDIKLVTSIDRNPADFPVLNVFNADDRLLALSEFRPGKMQWAFMTSRAEKQK